MKEGGQTCVRTVRVHANRRSSTFPVCGFHRFPLMHTRRLLLTRYAKIRPQGWLFLLFPNLIVDLRDLAFP